MKYPLTDAAKDAARQLVESWIKNKDIEQQFVVVEITRPNKNKLMPHIGFKSREVAVPSKSALRELAEFKLISVDRTKVDGDHINWDILLMQELCNAVATDFEVSEYYLPTHLTTLNELVKTLTGTLEDLVTSNSALADAIGGLTGATKADQQSKLGKLISELGNCLQHGANAVVVTQAIFYVSLFLRSLVH